MAYNRILLPVDGSEHSMHAVAPAVSLVREGGEIVVATVLPPIPNVIGGDARKEAEEAVKTDASLITQPVMDVIAKDSNPVTVKLEPEKVNGLLGTDVSREEMVRILEALDFKVEGDTIHVPSWRSDVEHYSDIAEEVARFYGYNNIPDTLSNGLTARRGLTDIQQTENLLGSVCRAAGYDEIITYSFISPTYYDKIDLPKDSPLRDSLKILNPLGEDTSIMRTTTLPSMLEILTRNYNFRNKSAKLYELGRVYFKRADGLADEPKVLTLGAYGGGMDFFALKGAVEAVLKQLRIENVRFLADTENPSYHPGRCAKVYCGDRLLGTLGRWRRGRRLYVRVNGQRARVIGSVGVSETLVDVTDLKCSAGDVVSFDLDPMYARGCVRQYR